MLINKWQKILGIEGILIYAESVSEEQVIADDSDCELVGVTVSSDGNVATIYHSRELKEDDVVHELLHVKHPSWREEEVNREMTQLIESRRGVS